VARLYVAYPDPEVWTYTGLMGAIVLLRDQSRNNAFFFRLVDLLVSNELIYAVYINIYIWVIERTRCTMGARAVQ
jgi:hypothetical protein